MTDANTTVKTDNDIETDNLAALIRGAVLSNNNGDRTTTTSLLYMARDVVDALDGVEVATG